MFAKMGVVSLISVLFLRKRSKISSKSFKFFYYLSWLSLPLLLFEGGNYLAKAEEIQLFNREVFVVLYFLAFFASLSLFLPSQKEYFARNFLLLFGCLFSMNLQLHSRSFFIFCIGFILSSFLSYVSIQGVSLQGKSKGTEKNKAFVFQIFSDFCVFLGLFLSPAARFCWVLQDMPQEPSLPLRTLSQLLICLGVCIKSAQWPFHKWFVDMPSTSSLTLGFLHHLILIPSGTLLVLRILPYEPFPFLYSLLFSCMGIIGFVFFSWKALRATDIRQISSYITLCVTAFILFFIGAGFYEIAKLFIIVHLLLRAALIGCMDCITTIFSGETCLNRMGGLKQRTPLSYTFTLFCFFTFIIGLFFVGEGFSALFLKWGCGQPKTLFILAYIIAVLCHGSVILRLFSRIFLGANYSEDYVSAHIKDPPFSLLLTLAAICIAALCFFVFTWQDLHVSEDIGLSSYVKAGLYGALLLTVYLFYSFKEKIKLIIYFFSEKYLFFRKIHSILLFFPQHEIPLQKSIGFRSLLMIREYFQNSLNQNLFKRILQQKQKADDVWNFRIRKGGFFLLRNFVSYLMEFFYPEGQAGLLFFTLGFIGILLGVIVIVFFVSWKG
jgi:NADH:ubiquinone oxidoreductase subunit 5 (subunit L)/multisubunit Na+/H+ antiporter MnhA subunit